MSRRRWWRAAATLLLPAALASCAPRHVAPPPLDTLRSAQRYRAAREARAALAGAVDAEVSAWLRGESIKSLPGVHARLALGAPEAFRVRIESMFGVALDFAAWGESLACFVPSKRRGVALDASADTFGVRSPGPLGSRLLGATWDPPDAAWDGAEYEDTLAVLAWQEEGDSLSLAVGSSGLPRWAKLRDARGASVEAWYHGWGLVERTQWPMRVELLDRGAGLTLALRLNRVVRNSRPAPDRLVVRIPPDAERLEWAAVREALSRARGLER